MAITVGILPEEEGIFYPETDGKPMAETDTHCNLIVNLIETLKDFFRNEPLVYVSGNLLIYFREGDRSACVAPDVFVVKGVPKEERRIYKLWEEGKTPDFVLELTSRSTAFEDLQAKWRIYEQDLQVKEYFLFDPLGEYLKPSFQGYRLLSGRYSPIRLVRGRRKSETLGLEIGLQERQVRLYQPQTGEQLLTPLEQAEARRQAEKRAQQAEQQAQREAEARLQAEEELARLRMEIEALRG